MAEELEYFWDSIRVRSPLRLVSGRANDIGSQLELAAEKASFDLKALMTRHRGEQLTSDLLSSIVSEGVRIFLLHWANDLRERDLSGLVEMVLEAQDLTPEELVGFVKAIPTSFLKRIVESTVGSASGIHGLMGVEYGCRTGTASNLRLVSEAERIRVTFNDQTGRVVQFFLDEAFELA